MNLEELVAIAISQKASDLHLIAGRPPTIRVNTKLVILGQFGSGNYDQILTNLLNPSQKNKLGAELQLDFAVNINSQRLRASIYQSLTGLSCSFRLIPTEIPNKDSLGLPSNLDRLLHTSQGIIFVTGPTGSGKTTTIASMLDEINHTQTKHILTIEDPIEYIFSPSSSIVSQREVGISALDWQKALLVAMRQDPDVIMVGEIRDMDSLDFALTLAETGHLVFTTLHAYCSPQAIERAISLFPPHHQDTTRIRLSMSLAAIISQRLLPTISDGRVLASEILFNSTSIINLIRENKLFQIDTIIQTSANEGMRLLEDDLFRLYSTGKISQQIALEASVRKSEFAKKFS